MTQWGIACNYLFPQYMRRTSCLAEMLLFHGAMAMPWSNRVKSTRNAIIDVYWPYKWGDLCAVSMSATCVCVYACLTGWFSCSRYLLAVSREQETCETCEVNGEKFNAIFHYYITRTYIAIIHAMMHINVKVKAMTYPFVWARELCRKYSQMWCHCDCRHHYVRWNLHLCSFPFLLVAILFVCFSHSLCQLIF